MYLYSKVVTPLHQAVVPTLWFWAINLVRAPVCSHIWHSLHHTKNSWAASSGPAPWFKVWDNTRQLRDNTGLPDYTPKYHSDPSHPRLLRRLTAGLSHQYCNTDVVSRRSPGLGLLLDLNQGSPSSTLDLLESRQKVLGVFNQLVP